jgi:hypothetical protein
VLQGSNAQGEGTGAINYRGLIHAAGPACEQIVCPHKQLPVAVQQLPAVAQQLPAAAAQQLPVLRLAVPPETQGAKKKGAGAKRAKVAPLKRAAVDEQVVKLCSSSPISSAKA